VENAQSAPHAGEQLFYPGTCRDRFSGWVEAVAAKGGAAPCWRFRTDAGRKVCFDDVFAGRTEQDVAATLGDFPVARDEFGAGYTLAVVVDDAAMGVSEVVRGDDLLPATPAQILVQRALGLPTPRYLHVPLVVGPDGRRLAKRHGDTRVSAFRAEGVSPGRIIGRLAASCGWAAENEEVELAKLVGRFDLGTIPGKPFMI
jgi:glutamyl-tRNA synthetase